MIALVRSIALVAIIATIFGCGDRAAQEHWPVSGDRIVAEITPALPWKAKQVGQFSVRFKVLDAQGNERGYLKEADVPIEVIPRSEITLLFDRGEASTRTLSMTADC